MTLHAFLEPIDAFTKYLCSVIINYNTYTAFIFWSFLISSILILYKTCVIRHFSFRFIDESINRIWLNEITNHAYNIQYVNMNDKRNKEIKSNKKK